MVAIAITGSPAVGKSTVSQVLKGQGWDVLSVRELAKQYDCEGDFDKTRDSLEIDVHKLSECYQPVDDEDVIIDGHLSHFLDVDAIIILRCDPEQLRSRLEMRGYDERKINANVEWELLSGTWSELMEFDIDVPILELDCTDMPPTKAAEEILAWKNSDFAVKNVEKITAIDWLSK